MDQERIKIEPANEDASQLNNLPETVYVIVKKVPVSKITTMSLLRQSGPSEEPTSKKCGIDTEKRINWTTDAVNVLIGCYQRNEAIWNPKHSEYFKANIRQAALKLIASEIVKETGLEVDASHVAAKIKTLRTGFSREIKLEQFTKNSGAIYKSKWQYFKKLFFLRDIVDPNESVDMPAGEISHDSQNENQNESILSLTDSAMESTLPPTEPFEVEEDEHSPISVDEQITISKVKKPKTSQPDDQALVNLLKTAIEALQSAQDNFKGTQDGCFHFGQSIADTLRSIPISLQLKAKRDITDILIKYVEEAGL